MYGVNNVFLMITHFLDFPESSLEIDLLIVSGTIETTQTVFDLARLSIIRLRKNLRLTLQLLQVP